MASLWSRGTFLLVLGICLLVLPQQAAAFGAGNIPSIAQVEGHNWRHGDIEDTLATIAFLHGKKWTSMLIKRVYFGNFLRDYSQALDVGTLKSVNAESIRILVWILSFMAFGYATEEFEVTAERLGTYRPEEHIDNPLGYADGLDARMYDSRLRGPVTPVETKIDPRTGMKNYIANETGQWATSAGYIRFSLARSIHYGRLYTNGASRKGNEEDLCEALRCMGQALHCLEDFTAHSNYCELALRELGYRNVFPHCGTQTEITVGGKRIFPLVTGTFGAVDFLHSVIGEVTDHFTQAEVDEVDIALKNAENGVGITRSGDGSGENRSRGFSFLNLGGSSSSSSGSGDFISLLSKVPGIGSGLAAQANELKAASEAQEQENNTRANKPPQHGNPNVIPGMDPNFDPVKTAAKIYPILAFRDKIVKTISRGIAKVPGLEKLLDHISETLTAFILGLLAPFIRPIIKAVSKNLKDGSSGVISASAKAQHGPWNNPHCSDPTHSMLAKDHFTNVLNACAGRVAVTMLQYAVPRILYAWENTSVPVDEVVNDILRSFHHPALRHDSIEIQRTMFQTVKLWADEHPRRHMIDSVLSSESVKAGKNHILSQAQHPTDHKSTTTTSGSCAHSHGAFNMLGLSSGHGKVAGSLWNQLRTRDLDAMQGRDNLPVNHQTSSPYAEQQPPPQGYAQNQYAGYNAPAPHPGQYVSGYGHPPPQGYATHPTQPQYAPQGAPPPGGWNQYPRQGHF